MFAPLTRLLTALSRLAGNVEELTGWRIARTGMSRAARSADPSRTIV
jgi:hypothetical protein